MPDGGHGDAPLRGRRRRLYRLLALVTVLEVAAAAPLYLRGFPYFGSTLVGNAAPWEAPVALFHAPAIAALYLSGQCCGLRNGSVLAPRVTGGHIRMNLTGLARLTLTNWLSWCALGALALLLPRPRRSRRPPLAPPG